MEDRPTELRREPTPPPPWYREHWWIFLVVLLLIVGGIIAFFALRDDGGGETANGTTTGGPQTVPDVVGEQDAAALLALRALGFSVDLVREENEEDEGIVFAQDPEAGSRLESGSLVVIRVSTGSGETETETVTETETETQTETETVPEPEDGVEMPDVEGQAYADAGIAVEEAGLVADTYPIASGEARGTVVGQSPSAGRKAEEGSVVRLDVAVGEGNRPLRLVPDVTGVGLTESHRLCRQARFTCKTIYQRPRSGQTPGDVVRQVPRVGVRAPVLAQLLLYTAR